MESQVNATNRTKAVARGVLAGAIVIVAALFWLAPTPIVSETLAQILGTPHYLPVVMLEATKTPTATLTSTPTPTATITPTPSNTPHPSGLAQNGGFESSDGGTGTGAANWCRWWVEIPKPCADVNSCPNFYTYAYKPDDFNRECLSSGAATAFILSGNCSFRVINGWNPYWAGAHQSLTVGSGRRIRLSAYGRAWASNNFFPAPSDVSVSVEMRVGIEPNGNCDPWSSSMIWSGAIVPHDTWQQASVEANAGSGGAVCLMLSTDYRGGGAGDNPSRQFMASFWDAVNVATVP